MVFEIHTIVSPSESPGLMLESLRNRGDTGKEDKIGAALIRKGKSRDIEGASFLEGGSGLGEEDFTDPLSVESLGEKIVGEYILLFTLFGCRFGLVSSSFFVTKLLRDTRLPERVSECS